LIKDRLALAQQEVPIARSRNATAAQLQRIRSQVGGLRSQLSKVVAAQAAAAARASGVSVPSGPVQVSSSGGFVFPLPKSAASPPGSWSPDQGVDISAPGDTPELAVCSGTIVLHGIGGFGPWAPVLHCDSPVGGYSYVYYGHAGPADQLPIGTHVGAGQVMSSIGPGIVGISTGPHLEIGFCDASGSPIGPQTAGTMMSLLQAAYGG
jgi:murein DD-endopeptidase MepM/ murein hydrolase activator NlpD